MTVTSGIFVTTLRGLDMGRMVQQKIEFWNDPEDPVDHDKDTFWIREAMERAVSMYWLRHVNKTGDLNSEGTAPWPNHLNITIDRELGTVIVSDY
jgi:hypothetical protein